MTIISVILTERKQHNMNKVKKKNVSGHVFFLDLKKKKELDPAFILNRLLFIKIYTCTGV